MNVHCHQETDNNSRTSVRHLCPALMENKPVRRRPPRTLQIPAPNEEGKGEEQKEDSAPSRPARSRNRNSALIEKLQADLALSPAALLPSPKSPGIRLPPPGLTVNCPRSPVTPTPGPEKKVEVEAPASFESPAEGALLPSINKGRARLSVRRRPPSRRIKKSGEEEVEAEVDDADRRPSSPVPEPAKGETKETHTGDAGELGAETTATSRAAPEGRDETQTQTEVSSQGEASTATVQEDCTVEVPTAQQEEDEKSPTESAKHDSTSGTTVSPETDQTSSVKEGQSGEKDRGSPDLKNEPPKNEG